MIAIPRGIIVALAAVFSAYHLVLGLFSLHIPVSPWPSVLAMGLYLIATVASLWPSERLRLRVWIVALDLGVAVVIPLLVTAALDPTRDNGYATWYVAAIGTLMTILAVRGGIIVAWVGVGFLALQTVLWAGVGALGGIGVIGSMVWVAVAQISTATIAKATRDARAFAVAQRGAEEWKAAQDARTTEREARLRQTERVAAPMLRRIVESDGLLSEQERADCRLLEATIRDEIRGRALLDDGVRDAVRTARSSGITVTLLDDGGIDDLAVEEHARVRSSVSAAIRGATADRIIVRTVAGTEVAATVVGIVEVDDDEDGDVSLWLEIPRSS
jgi:hypothetical protein